MLLVRIFFFSFFVNKKFVISWTYTTYTNYFYVQQILMVPANVLDIRDMTINKVFSLTEIKPNGGEKQ